MRLTKTQQKAIACAADQQAIRLLILFGSVARGDATKKSDVDIGYLGAHPLDLQATNRLTNALQIALEMPDRQIDLVDLAHAPPLLARLVIEDGVKLFGSDEDEDAFYRLAINRYIDAKPLRESTRSYVQSRLALSRSL